MTRVQAFGTHVEGGALNLRMNVSRQARDGAGVVVVRSRRARHPVIVSLLLLAVSGGMAEAAQKNSNPANARETLGAKVSAALARLSGTLADAATIDVRSATTAQLLATHRELQTARAEFNAVDHAFKGQLSGLSLEQVAPSLAALDLAQLRVQDELQRCGVPPMQIDGYRSALDWLASVAPDAYVYFRVLHGRSTRAARIESAIGSYALNIANGLMTARQVADAVSDDPGVMPDIAEFRDIAPPFYTALANPPAGGIEAALARVLAIYGYTSRLPGFGDDIDVTDVPREPRPRCCASDR